MIKVSIIIPIYNTPIELVNRAVRSAANQIDSLEIIAVDDGNSPEKAAEIDNLLKEIPKTRLLHKRNGGVSTARNAGIEAAKGEYIAFLDADDALEPGYLNAALKLIEEKEADVVLGTLIRQSLDGSIRYYRNYELGNNVITVTDDQIIHVAGAAFDESCLRAIGLKPARYDTNSGILFRRASIGDVRFISGIVISEDRLFNFDVFKQCKKILITGISGYRYVERPGSASKQFRRNAGQELVATAKQIEKRRNSSGPILYQSLTGACVECFVQTLEFTIARREFAQNCSESRTEFVRKLLAEPVYYDAFASLVPVGIKKKILKIFVIHRMSLGVAAIALIKSLISKEW